MLLVDDNVNNFKTFIFGTTYGKQNTILLFEKYGDNPNPRMTFALNKTCKITGFFVST